MASKTSFETLLYLKKGRNTYNTFRRRQRSQTSLVQLAEVLPLEDPKESVQSSYATYTATSRSLLCPF